MGKHFENRTGYFFNLAQYRTKLLPSLARKLSTDREERITTVRFHIELNVFFQRIKYNNCDIKISNYKIKLHIFNLILVSKLKTKVLVI